MRQGSPRPPFQFTLPCRERRRSPHKNQRRRRFNSRSRVGSDTVNTLLIRQISTFQFTLPCRERLSELLMPVDNCSFQFTLPCRERQRRRERTPYFLRFQFTLPCRERQTQKESHHDHHSFNSRSRVGSDRRPLRGRWCRARFNSRSRVGSDRHHQSSQEWGDRFNSRSRVGSDQRRKTTGYLEGFQFTLPCRERLGDGAVRRVAPVVSIHAPV